MADACFARVLVYSTRLRAVKNRRDQCMLTITDRSGLTVGALYTSVATFLEKEVLFACCFVHRPSIAVK